MHPSTFRWLRGALVLAIALTVAAAAGLATLKAREGGLEAFGQMPAFHLVDQEGRAFSDADFVGKPLLVGFIFTTCDDICPVVTSQMRTVQEELAAAGLLDRIQLLSISVDPERDTPGALARYAEDYGLKTASWRLATGDPEHVRGVVVDGFLLGYQKVARSGGHGQHGGSGDYRVDHSGRVVLVDGAGQIRAYYDGTDLDPDEVVRDLQAIDRRGD